MLLPPSNSSANAPPRVEDDDPLSLTGCVVCGDEVPDGTVCSRDCAIEAERQVAGNVAELRQLDAADHNRARRRVLTARNGRLTDAMLSWRPEDADGQGR